MHQEGRIRGRGKCTRAIHSGWPAESLHGEISVPIYQSATFAFPSADEGAARFVGAKSGYIYTRLDNPTVNALEAAVAALEGGAAGLASATGMAAVSTVFLALLGADAHVVATDALYGASRVILESELRRFGVDVTFVDTSRIEQTRAALQARTRLVYLETPTNPTMVLTDIASSAQVAHEHGALVAVDNTFASPYLQRPLEHGADIVVHSLTKYLNGHSDVVGGMIVSREHELAHRMRRVLRLFGGTMDPHQAWLILRGIRTLALRMEKAQENALKLALFLKDHPKVEWVRYPGLREHPQHELARRQMDGFGAMLCFGVRNGLAGGKIVMDAVRLITLAVSLGGVESLIEHPASMTHTAVPRAEREHAGIHDELVRLSVGCEDFEDLRADLDQALWKIP
jgi:methionine-gamma-lyase